MGGDRVEELGSHLRLERRRSLLDQSKCRGGRGRAGAPRPSAGRSARPSARACGRRRGGARPSRSDRRAAAGGAGRAPGRSWRRRPCARADLPHRRGGRRAWRARRRMRRRVSASSTAPTVARSPGARRSAARKSRKPVELVCVAAHGRRERGRIGLGLLDRADVELEAVAEALDSAEHPDGVALREARSRAARRRARLDPRSDLSGRRARARGSRHPSGRADAACVRRRRRRRSPGPPRARQWRSLRPSLGRKAAGRLGRVARISSLSRDPLRRGAGRAARPADRAAVRRDRAGGARALPRGEPVQRRASDPSRRRGRRGKPVAELAGARRPRSRRRSPALWWLAQDYVGPDGVARTRDGLVCALHVEPYSASVILPHERTHAGPKEGRMRLLRALRAHVEPIFLLYDGTLAGPVGEPLVDVELEGVRNRLWRVEADRRGTGRRPAPDRRRPPPLRDGARLPRGRDGTEESAWLLAVVVPTDAGGVEHLPDASTGRRCRSGRR